MNWPKWAPHPVTLAAAFVLGAVAGIIDGVLSERRLRREEAGKVWDQTTVSNPVGSDGSGNAGANPPNGADAGSDIQVPPVS